MREIKFRAWDKITKKYFYSGTLDNGDVLVIHLDGEIEISSDDTYKPDDFIIEELIGIRDQNRRIYEGDVIDGNLFDNRLPIRGVVVYDDRHCFYAIKNDAGITALFRIANITQIGTIHENPELLS